MQKAIIIFIFILSLLSYSAESQDLMDLLGNDKPAKELTTATFKTTHLIIGQSVENVAKGHLNVIISHHFGQINGGLYNFEVIMDDSNNTPDIIDQNVGIIDVHIEPARGLQKIIHRITVYKTGGIAASGSTTGA